MIGRATAALKPFPRRWLERVWGCPDISMRQKWMVLWPILRQMPREGLTVLDAGCGAGLWSLELAARHPHWTIIAIDREAAHIQRAEKMRQQLGLRNIQFRVSDFLQYQAEARFDIVLSVFSAHYLMVAGGGSQLFGCFQSWLKPNGKLIFLGPRQISESPFHPLLPRQRWYPVFSIGDLKQLCHANQMEIEQLCGRIGRLGVLAKQIDLGASHWRRWFYVLSYPVIWGMTVVDVLLSSTERSASLVWLMVACKTSARH